ncbi:MAG: response regulator transcription factor, partial [Bacteroidetes bacterium]|nr:response regulator transcription factor [Bacteroidota bacterium]
MDGLQRSEADILITSLSLGGNAAINMIGDVKAIHSALPILVLTMHPEERFAVKTLRSGASGYLTKDIAPEEIISAVRTLVSGKPYITCSLAEKLAMESGGDVGKRLHDSLSAREFQIMCALASGKKTAAIA